MSTIDARRPITTSTCPRCDYHDAYPAIVSGGEHGPEFKLVCAFCGTPRDFHTPIPIDLGDPAKHWCTPDGNGVCTGCGEPLYHPGLRHQPRTCRVCGCTDTNCAGCIERTGAPCSWVPGEKDLCTACVDEGLGGRIDNEEGRLS